MGLLRTIENNRGIILSYHRISEIVIDDLMVHLHIKSYIDKTTRDNNINSYISTYNFHIDKPSLDYWCDYLDPYAASYELLKEAIDNPEVYLPIDLENYTDL